MNIANILIGPILSIIDKAVPDKTAAAKMKGEIEQIVLQNEAAMLEAASAVAMADAKSEGWMTRNARPLTVINMLVIANVIVVAGVINPDSGASSAAASVSTSSCGLCRRCSGRASDVPGTRSNPSLPRFHRG
jgi:hypothetical protein